MMIPNGCMDPRLGVERGARWRYRQLSPQRLTRGPVRHHRELSLLSSAPCYVRSEEEMGSIMNGWEDEKLEFDVLGSL